MKNIRKLFAGVLTLVLLLGILAGCGTDPAVSANGSDEDVITVQVGTMGTYSPFSYYDEDNNITGYDIEVLRLVEETDPSLHFEFTSGAWESLFPGLDADKYQMLANQISGTEERRQKYYLTETSYHTAVNQIIVKGGRTDIQSFEDLEGKVLGLTVGDAHNVVAEEWNEAHGNILTIQYYNEDVTTILQDIVNGRIDATLNDPAVAISKAQIQGLDVEPVGDRLEETPVFFIFKQDEVGKELRDKIDAALKKLIESGRLSQLSTEWFGADYVPKADDAALQEVTTIQVGTMGTYSPFSYYNDDNNLTGYDIEVLRLVEATDPSLHFEFTSGAWESLFPGLDADKYQMLANQISSTEERLEKYYLSDISYHVGVNQIIVKGGRTDINSLEDLAGKTLGLTVGDAHNDVAEKWNEEHDNAINIQYYSEDVTTVLQDIVNGRIDATLNDPVMAVSKAEIQGLDIVPVGERLEETPVYFIYKKDDAGKNIQERIDAALQTLLENGKLSELSIEWFGADYVPDNSAAGK